MNSIYDFSVKDINGNLVSMSQYKNNVLLIVNTASKCGFRVQFEDLENLYDTYKDKGLIVLGFPCNQFLSQEPNSNLEIKQICERKFKINFPMFSKIDVNGQAAHPLFKFLKCNAKGFLWTEFIKWNFTKFLVDKNGKVIKRYAPYISPKSIEKDIKDIL